MLSTPSVPTISTTAATCSSAGTSTVSNYSAGLTYIFDPIGPAVGAGGAITGMTAGTGYVVRADNGSCASADSASFSNAVMLVTPSVPTISTTAATCSSAGTSTVSNYSAGLTYIFDPSGPAVGAGGAITGMTAGTGYVVRAGNGSCVSADSASFSNAVMLVTPSVPTISTTAATCSSAGTSTVSNYSAGLTYIFDPSGPAVGAGGAITGMTAGTGYVVRADNGSCASADSASFSNAAMLSTPSVPTISSVIQPTCNIATGSFTISNYDIANIYNITPAGATLDTATGIVIAQVGTYNLTATSNGCSSISSSVVINSKVCAEDDNTFAVQTTAFTPATVGNVTDNDTLNGLAVTASNTDVTPITTGPLSIDANGVLTLAANTVSGTYTIVYQLCETGAVPSNCDTATATVVVGNPIIANDDTAYSTQVTATTTTIVGNVTGNDTLNGLAVTGSNTDATPITTGPLSIDANGVLTLAPNTVPGTYTIVYQLCEIGAVPSNCDTATATVVVDNDILATNDGLITVDGINGSLEFINILDNDLLNGLPINPCKCGIFLIHLTSPYFEFNSDGTVSVKPNTPGRKLCIDISGL